MRTRLFALALCAVFPLCAACSGSTNRTPSIRTTMTPPQEYRQEENLPNNPGSLFAASDSDTLFSDSRARRVGDIVIVKLVENTKAQHKAETSVDKDNNNNYGVSALMGQSKVGFLPFVIENSSDNFWYGLAVGTNIIGVCSANTGAKALLGALRSGVFTHLVARSELVRSLLDPQ